MYKNNSILQNLSKNQKSGTNGVISDQFAFRPTGSTTAANHHASSLLTTNLYVSLFSLDFTKAFDSVRHDTLSQKLASLNIPDEIYNWLVTFLNGRSHVTRYAGRTSSIAYISGSQPVGRGQLVGRGPLPGGPRPRLGIENFLCESRVAIHEKVHILSSGVRASAIYLNDFSTY